MNNEPNQQRGAQVKSGDLFGIDGFWVNKDQNHHEAIVEAEASDQVPGHSGASGRLIYIYWGKTRPTPEEIDSLLN
ncbi:hypothetical protein J2N86_15035 (plasmid) [Legionella lytica]|uniref:Uncharacterized protein n=1 Tax=Legionella lytica TaxID=96232 RepID=A0ABY4YCP7_9GAMM|nr:hypothetical protein [Legionella lytica]USQ15274.1 hypothetical protein J2N86_15035 [Legionella lytica]